MKFNLILLLKNNSFKHSKSIQHIPFTSLLLQCLSYCNVTSP